MKAEQYTAQQIIDRRKKLWAKDKDIQLDKDFRESVAARLIQKQLGKDLRRQIKSKPELLIEMFFVIVDKEQNTVPFFFNDIQKEFEQDLDRIETEYSEGKRVSKKVLVLKGRQQGFTSYITARQLAYSLISKNFSGFTLADSGDNTNTIFEDKAKFVYNNLPEAIRPIEEHNNRKELTFSGLNSKWRVATAGNRDVGRSKTINFFHGSEAGFFPSISDILKALGQALTKDSISILESTANGYNEFKDLWDDEVWESLFYEWYKTPEYTQDFESKEREKDFKDLLKSGKSAMKEPYDGCFATLIMQKDILHLEVSQIYWYYCKALDLKEAVKQEYPNNADEAFIASGGCVFNVSNVISRIEYLKQQPKPRQGQFAITWNDAERKDYPIGYEWKDSPTGCIKIVREPKDRFPYVLGGDTKGEGSDWFTGTIINNNTKENCATLHFNSLQSKVYTAQMWALANYYNKALIGIEVNFNTYPIELINEWQYTFQYVREKFDTYEGTLQKKFGWKTDGTTRPLIIEREIAYIDEHIELFNDIDMLRECLSFVDKDGRADAESGKHDDILFSDMIARASSCQQTTLVMDEPINHVPKLLKKLKPNSDMNRKIRR